MCSSSYTHRTDDHTKRMSSARISNSVSHVVLDVCVSELFVFSWKYLYFLSQPAKRMTNILVKLNSNLSNVTEKKTLFFFPQDSAVVLYRWVFAFRLFYITQSTEMFTKHEINVAE